MAQTSRFLVQMEASLLQRADAKAKRRGVSRAEYVRSLVLADLGDITSSQPVLVPPSSRSPGPGFWPEDHPDAGSHTEPFEENP